MYLSLAIERQRRPLLRIVATLYALIGLVEGGQVERLERRVYRAVLRVLRPAESAVRRLIVVAAHGIALKPAVARTAPKRPVAARGDRRSRVTFKLFDPRRHFGSAFAHERPRFRPRIKLAPRPEPRIRVIDAGFDPRVPLFRKAPPIVQAPPPPPVPDGTVNAARLCRRLAAIKLALEDLPRQARRYARWQAKPAARSLPQRSAPARRQGIARTLSTRSMRSWLNAIGSPAKRPRRTPPEGACLKGTAARFETITCCRASLRRRVAALPPKRRCLKRRWNALGG